MAGKGEEIVVGKGIKGVKEATWHVDKVLM